MSIVSNYIQKYPQRTKPLLGISHKQYQGLLTQSRPALRAFYLRLRSRLGTPKAITATVHKLARMFYLLSYVDNYWAIF